MLEIKDNNIVKIEGVLSEIDLNYGSFQKNGTTVDSIGGVIKIRVTQKVNGEDRELEVPVHMFAGKTTNKGTANPAYESIERVKNDYVSIAASDIDHADRIRITRGNINMNEYYGQNGNLISFPRINASFVTKVTDGSFKPEATFSAIFVVGQKGFEMDSDGVENPDRYKISAILPQYGGRVDVVTFFATSKGVIDAVSNYWNPGDTVKANGRLNFTSRTETTITEVDFGEPKEDTRTISVSELIITGGSQSPLDGEFASSDEEVRAALADRTARLAALKEKQAARGKGGKAPSAPVTGNEKYKDLGF